MSESIWIPPHGSRISPGCHNAHLYEAAVADGRLRRWYQPGTSVVSYFSADEPVASVVHHAEWTSYRTIKANGDVVETDRDPTKPRPISARELEIRAPRPSKPWWVTTGFIIAIFVVVTCVMILVANRVSP